MNIQNIKNSMLKQASEYVAQNPEPAPKPFSTPTGSEVFNIMATTPIAAGTGAVLSAIAAEHFRAPEIVTPAAMIAGGLGPSLLAAGLAAVTPERSAEDQAKHDASALSTIVNTFVPGAGIYNALKRAELNSRTIRSLQQQAKDKQQA